MKGSTTRIFFAALLALAATACETSKNNRLNASKEPHQTIRLASELLQENKGSFTVMYYHYRRGKAYYDTKQYGAAVKDFEELLRRFSDPQSPHRGAIDQFDLDTKWGWDSLYYMAISRFRLGDYAGAASDFEGFLKVESVSVNRLKGYDRKIVTQMQAQAPNAKRMLAQARAKLTSKVAAHPTRRPVMRRAPRARPRPAGVIPGWQTVSSGKANDRVVATDGGRFRIEVGHGGFAGLTRKVQGRGQFISARVENAPALATAKWGVYIRTDDGAVLKLERIQGVETVFVRFSIASQGKDQGSKQIACPTGDVKLHLQRDGDKFVGCVYPPKGMFVEVGSLDWPGLQPRQEIGIFAEYPSKHGPAKLLFNFSSFYGGPGKG